MYAAAIWDRVARTLCLARDPLGIKPLFVTEQLGGLAFASEITALRVLPGHRFDIDERGVHDFFSFGHVLGPRSIFSQVRTARARPCAPRRPDRRSGDPALLAAARRGPQRPFRSANGSSETRERVLGTVEQHMLSDVPVGAFLSGGVDSGAIAAAMARTSAPGFKVFTAGFPGSQHRRDRSRARSRRAPRLPSMSCCRSQPQTAADVLPAVQRAFDEPIGRQFGHSALVSFAGRRRACQGRAVRRGRRRAVPGLQPPALGAADGIAGGRLVRALGGLRFLDAPAANFRRASSNYLRQHAPALPRRGAAGQRLRAVLRRGDDHLAGGSRAHLRSRILAPAGGGSSLAGAAAEHFPPDRAAEAVRRSSNS